MRSLALVLAVLAVVGLGLLLNRDDPLPADCAGLTRAFDQARTERQTALVRGNLRLADANRDRMRAAAERIDHLGCLD